MGMQGPDFLTKKQMKEQVALPKVGVTYDDGSGRRRSFSVGDMGDFGSLDAAFGAAAAGVRRGRNLDLAMSLNAPQGAQTAQRLRTSEKSGVRIDGDQIMLRGEESGGHLRSGRFFGTDEHDKPGWHDINDIDKPTKGVLIGKTLNTECAADSSSKEIGSCDAPWSEETSRTAIRVDEETGEILFCNYYRTEYYSKFGRKIGRSPEVEVVVAKIKGGGGDYCAKPVVDGSGNVTGIEFGTNAQLKAGTPSKTASMSAGVDYCAKPVVDGGGNVTGIEFGTNAQLKAGTPSKSTSISSGAKYGVRADYDAANGILSSLKFGTDEQLERGAYGYKVDTYLGCPYSQQ